MGIPLFNKHKKLAFIKVSGTFPKNNFNIRWFLQLKNKYVNIRCSDGHKT
jgi:hypothetical protein